MSSHEPFAGLMAGLRAKDHDAAREVVDRYALRLIRLAEKKLPAALRSKEDPEDTVQSALNSFITRTAKGQLTAGNWDELWTLLTYLTACKVNRRIRKYLAEKRDVRKEAGRTGEDEQDPGAIDPAAPGGTPEEAAMLVETVEWLMAQLDDPVAQKVLSMRLEGYTVGEIAAAVRKSEETVFRYLKKVRGALQKRLAGDTAPAR